jgi:hypothetical protein
MRTVPAVARQLASEGPTREAVNEAFNIILDNQISLVVIYWPHDEFTPYQRRDDLSSHPHFRQIKVRKDSIVPNLRTSVSAHMHIRDHEDTTNQLLQILLSI